MSDLNEQIARQLDDLERRLSAVERVEGGGGGWTLIHTETLTGTQASFDYQSIPQTYNALWVWLLTRCTNNDFEDIYLYLNNDTTDANYRTRIDGGAINSFPIIGVTTGNTGTTGAYGLHHLFIQGYAQAYIHAIHAIEANAPKNTNISTRDNVIRWETAAAITRITVKPRPAGLLSLMTGSQMLVFAA